MISGKAEQRRERNVVEQDFLDPGVDLLALCRVDLGDPAPAKLVDLRVLVLDVVRARCRPWPGSGRS